MKRTLRLPKKEGMVYLYKEGDTLSQSDRFLYEQVNDIVAYFYVSGTGCFPVGVEDIFKSLKYSNDGLIEYEMKKPSE